MEYKDFLKTKAISVLACGRELDANEINPILFPFQRDLVRWACRKGRSAIFADTGLGKTFMQLEWARLVAMNTLIVAPLSVARQTVREADKLGMITKYARSQAESIPGVTITNYEMIDSFDASKFQAVVLDESSILKGLASKTRAKLIEQFECVPHRLCCTATPAPNDVAEIANHAHFLGIMTRPEMLATFFVHDANNSKMHDKQTSTAWRLKRHAEDHFYRWLASWGMAVRKPSDLGYSDEGYDLPPLNIIPSFVDTNYKPDDTLFFMGLKGVGDRAKVRKATMAGRIEEAVKMVNQNGDQWIVWCGLNAESSAMADCVPDAVEVKGSDPLEKKIEAIEGFQDGRHRVLVTKPRIAGFGMNFQNAHKMAFVGLSDSWEAYYQCIRREWRFGQEHPVDAHIILADIERPIYRNVKRKEKEAIRMGDNLIKHVKEYEKTELSADVSDHTPYIEEDATGEGWDLMLGDSVERMKSIKDESVGLSVFSPPFSSLYTYSASPRDLGNSKSTADFWEHFQFIIEELKRVTMPGRNCAVHVSELGATASSDGFIGLKDFPGDTIRAFNQAGWIYHGRVTIDKNPQSQAIRTKAKALLFVQLNKDSSWSRPAIADTILVFRKPGENRVPVDTDIDNETWIKWAHPIWYGILEGDVLRYQKARAEKDERHICPLQLETIRRCVRLWSNPGELVCSPFAGIGSEGYESLKLGRRFWGCELKPSYFNIGVVNLKRAVEETHGLDLFSGTMEDSK